DVDRFVRSGASPPQLARREADAVGVVLARAIGVGGDVGERKGAVDPHDDAAPATHVAWATGVTERVRVDDAHGGGERETGGSVAQRERGSMGGGDGGGERERPAGP